MYSGVNFGGPQTVVTLNRGAADGLEVGHVLAIDAAGPEVTNRYQVTRPTISCRIRNGLLFVFRVFDRVSYAMVMSATRPGGGRGRVHALIRSGGHRKRRATRRIAANLLPGCV
jgi:hypothetical protein